MNLFRQILASQAGCGGSPECVWVLAWRQFLWLGGVVLMAALVVGCQSETAKRSERVVEPASQAAPASAGLAVGQQWRCKFDAADGKPIIIEIIGVGGDQIAFSIRIDGTNQVRADNFAAVVVNGNEWYPVILPENETKE